MAEVEQNIKNFPIQIGPIPASAANAEKAKIWAEGTDEQVEALGGEHSAKGWVETIDVSSFMPKSGGTFTGNVTMASGKTINFTSSKIGENVAGNIIVGDGNGNGLVVTKNGSGAALFTSNGSSYTELVKRSDVKSTYSSTGTYPVNGTAVAAAIAADALTNGTSETSSLAVGSTTSASNSTIVGKLSSASYAYSTTVGYNTYSTALYGTAVGHTAGAAGSKAVAVGAGAIASASGAIQLGEGTNSTSNTLQVGSTQLLDSSGKVPSARLSAMTGADGSNAGTSGIVPAPAATDNVKYLKGDGTWASVDSLPSQTGNSGKFLTTNGTTASWATVQSDTTTYTWYTGNTGTTVTIQDTTGVNALNVYKNGLLLQPTQDYTISGTTLTLTTALVSTDKITVVRASAGVTTPSTYIISTWHQGTDYCRIWSDGWCEQGGYVDFASSGLETVITFHQAFKDTNYMCTYSPISHSAANWLWSNSSPYRQTSQISVWSDGNDGGINWEAKGYIS